MLRAERIGKQLFGREAAADARESGDVDRRAGRSELANALAAGAARRHQRRPVAEHQDAADGAPSVGDHGRDGACLGAGSDRIGGVLDVAAGMDDSALVAQRGTDAETGIGSVGALPRGERRREEVGDGGHAVRGRVAAHIGGVRHHAGLAVEGDDRQARIRLL